MDTNLLDYFIMRFNGFFLMYNSTPNNLLSYAEASAIQTCETNSVDRFVDLEVKLKYLSVIVYVKPIFQ